MTIDWDTDCYSPIFSVLGVPATMNGIAITVIDKTRPTTSNTNVRSTNISGGLEVRSVGPGAYARIPELTAKGIVRDNYMNAVLSFNGRTWAVRSYELGGSPNGEDVGQVHFLLKAIESSDG